MPTVTPQALTRTVQDFLSEAAGAVVLENGAVAFDLAQSKYSISGEYNRCLLHLWSAERNAVRRVLEAEVKNGTLRLAVQRLGQARPSKLEICRERDRRSPSTRRACRAAYEQKLRRTLERHFPEFKIARLTSWRGLWRNPLDRSMREGLMRQGRTAFALLGVNAQETQSSIDAALTFGILWLDVCRQAQAANVLVEGLKLFRSGRNFRAGAGADGEPEPRCRQVVAVRTGRTARRAGGNRLRGSRQRVDAAGACRR